MHCFKHLIFILTAFTSIQASKNTNQTHSVRFHVFTTETQNDSFKSFDLKDENNKTKLSNICNSKKPLFKLIVHGFAEEWNMKFRWNWVDELIKELLKSSEASSLCIIAVDWKELAYGGNLVANYWNAISNMQNASDIMVNYFANNKMNHSHCIGFSLGAHMCSIFAKNYYAAFKVKINRITGLDPAGPFFGSKPTTEKLHLTDADLVDIIHTSDDLGLVEKNGHMDFYPDDGPSHLKSCKLDKRLENADLNEEVILFEEEGSGSNFDDVLIDDRNINFEGLYNATVTSFMSGFKSVFNFFKNLFFSKPKRLFMKAHQFFGCSHLMAVKYFINSINECIYKANFCIIKNASLKQPCLKGINFTDADQFPRMGYWASKSASVFKTTETKFFFVNTTDTAPYCYESDMYGPKKRISNILVDILLKPKSESKKASSAKKSDNF